MPERKSQDVVKKTEPAVFDLKRGHMEITVPKLWDFEYLDFLTDDLVSQIADDVGVGSHFIHERTESGAMIPKQQTVKYRVSDNLISQEMKTKLEYHYQEYLRKKDAASIPHQGPGKGMKRSKESA